MRVGVWDTPTLFVQVDVSKAGRWNMAGEPPFSRQLAECPGTFPLRHPPQLGGAFNALPNAELQVVDTGPSAACPKQVSTKGTPQKEHGSFVSGYRSMLPLLFEGTRWDSLYPRRSQNFGSLNLNFGLPMARQVSRLYLSSTGR